VFKLTLTPNERLELHDLSMEVVELLLQCDDTDAWYSADTVVVEIPENVCWDLSDSLYDLSWSELSKGLADKLDAMNESVDLKD